MAMDIDLVHGILNTYIAASDDIVEEGINWYPRAQDVCRDIAGSKWHRAAGVIAALSPMQRWVNNVTLARRVWEQGHAEGCGLGQNCRKAERIYNGEDALDVLGGEKVTNFFLTILDPSLDPEPVIDRHAFDIAVGKRCNDSERSILQRKGEYARFAAAYREAANRTGLLSWQIQAVTWAEWKARHRIW